MLLLVLAAAVATCSRCRPASRLKAGNLGISVAWRQSLPQLPAGRRTSPAKGNAVIRSEGPEGPHMYTTAWTQKQHTRCSSPARRACTDRRKRGRRAAERAGRFLVEWCARDTRIHTQLMAAVKQRPVSGQHVQTHTPRAHSSSRQWTDCTGRQSTSLLHTRPWTARVVALSPLMLQRGRRQR